MRLLVLASGSGAKWKIGSMVGSQGWEMAVGDEVYAINCFVFYLLCFVVRNYKN